MKPKTIQTSKFSMKQRATGAVVLLKCKRYN